MILRLKKLRPNVLTHGVRVSSKHQGKFIEVSFKFALEQTGMEVYSGGKGRYSLAKETPGSEWFPISSPPGGSTFLYNRITKTLLFKKDDEIMCTIKC